MREDDRIEPVPTPQVAGIPSGAMAAIIVANAAVRRGDTPAAVRQYRQVLATWPECAEAHANLAFVLNSMRRFGDAEAHFTRALARQPNAVPVLLGVAFAQQRQGRWREAAAHYRRALALKPTLASAEVGLGLCMLGLSRLGDAGACFQRALHADAECVEAYHLLSTLRHFDGDDAVYVACESLRPRVASMPALRQARYWFALGKMREDAARYDAAFAAYAAGNRARASLFVLDEAPEEERARRIRETFDARALAGCAHPSTPGDRTPVFIIGMPRSGTSLVEQILASHSGVYGAGEISELQVVLRERLGDSEPWTALVALTAAARRDLGAAYLERVWKRAPKATHIGNKMPSNYRFVGAIRMLLPQARIIHCVRDPMDSCWSCYTHLFEGDSLPYTYDLRALGRYYVRYRALMRHWRAAAPDALLDVCYEDLATDTESQVRRLLDYLGLAWEARCLDFHRNPRLVVTASRAQVRRPMYQHSIARWKHFETHLQPLRELVEAEG